MIWSQPTTSSNQPFRFGVQISTRNIFITHVSIVVLIIVVIILSIVMIRKVKKERFHLQAKSNRDICIDQIQLWYDKLVNNPLKEKKITEEEVKQAWPNVELLLTWLVGPCINGFWTPQTVSMINRVTKLSDLPNFSASLVNWWSKYLGNLKYDEKQILEVSKYFTSLWNTSAK